MMLNRPAINRRLEAERLRASGIAAVEKQITTKKADVAPAARSGAKKKQGTPNTSSKRRRATKKDSDA